MNELIWTAETSLLDERSADLLNRAAKAQTGDPPFVHDRLGKPGAAHRGRAAVHRCER
jgi:hypothetical protein